MFFVAVRKTNRKTGKKKSQIAQVFIIFWLVFLIVIISVFMVNGETIKKNFTLFKTRLTTSPGAEEMLLTEEKPEESAEPSPVAVVRETPPARPAPVTAPQPPKPSPTPERPTAQPQQQRPQVQPQTQSPPTAAQAETRDRNIYFTQINKDGHILHSRVTRKVPVSDSPMQDALTALLKGPSADEINHGMLNLIPQDTRILSATVRGSTAYISFSEDFMFNTFGVEGYVAQLRQIVWTVTEFSNVKDVQILVEGRRVDYLGEGIWIGSPISRHSF
jgi:hypothetical protein